MNSLFEIKRYKDLFAKLNVKVADGEKAPNKPILLISIMELVRCGYITENRIGLDDTVKIAFEYYWGIFVNTPPPTVWTPFWHMKNERFWHFKPINSQSSIDQLVPAGYTASIGKMRSAIAYAYFDDALFTIMQTSRGRNALYSVLISFYGLNIDTD